MQAIRAQNTAVIDMIKPNFIVGPDGDRDSEANELLQMMQLTPDKVFIGVAIDGKSIIGHIIAWLPYNRNFVWIDQARCEDRVPVKLRKDMFNNLRNWAKNEMNVDELRCETSRSPDAFELNWGFKKLSEILKCSI